MIPAEKPARTIPAQIVFDSDGWVNADGTEVLVYYARLLAPRVLDTSRDGWRDRVVEVERARTGRHGIIARVEANISPDGETTARGWIQGAGYGSRRYNVSASGDRAITEAQEHVIRWASRRFRLPAV